MKIKQALSQPFQHSVFKPYIAPLAIELLEFIGEEADAARDIQYASTAVYLQNGANNDADSNLLGKIKKFAETQIATKNYLHTHVAEKTPYKAWQSSFLKTQPEALQDILKAAPAYHQAEGEVKEKQADDLVVLAKKLGELNDQKTIERQAPGAPRQNQRCY